MSVCALEDQAPPAATPAEVARPANRAPTTEVLETVPGLLRIGRAPTRPPRLLSGAALGLAVASFWAPMAGCGPASVPGPDPIERAAPSPAQPPPVDLIAAIDARQALPLLEAARSPSVVERRAAVWGLARLHDDQAVPGLVAALRDEDPQVRRAAAFGIGALEAEAPPDAVEALLGAYASEAAGTEATAPPGPPAQEPLATVRSAMVWSLARTASARAAPALRAALSDAADSRLAACRGLAYGGASGWDPALLEAALQRADEDPSPQVREACWFGLGRTALPSSLHERATSAALAALSAPATGAALDAELRVLAARVLGRLPGTDATRAQLAHATQDPEWRVAVAAFRALASQSAGHEPLLAEALRAGIDHWLPEAPSPAARTSSAPGVPSSGPLATEPPGVGPPGAAAAGPSPADPPVPGGASSSTPGLSGGRLHVILAALESAQDHARDETVHGVATTLLARLQRRTAEPLSRDRGWLHCAAARLVDLGRGWPGRVESCGLEQVPREHQRALAAQVLARVEGAEPQRAVYLQRLWREGPARVQQAVLEAAGHLSLEAALPFARTGLASLDEGVLIAALELVSVLAAPARRARDDAALLASLQGRPSSEPARFLAELDPLLAGLTERLTTGTNLEARIALSTAVASLADPGAAGGQDQLVGAVRQLALDASRGVRAAALEALRALEVESTGTVATPTDLVSSGELALDAREAVLRTTRGTVVIELWPDQAPVTVSRFVELATGGFFDGLSFHRVVPGFVVQGGDPRGDGYGGPAWWQRCEDNLASYDRGVVGMALAGRDTGGSQFFITLGPQHHLEGRYTAFGRVREGLEHIDELQVGDEIQEVSIVRGEPSQAYPPEVLQR